MVMYPIAKARGLSSDTLLRGAKFRQRQSRLLRSLDIRGRMTTAPAKQDMPIWQWICFWFS